MPDVPVRQWVLTLPHRLRYRLAWDHQGCRAVTRLFVRAVFGCLRRRLRERGVAGGRGGAVVVLQRFGGELNLNVHLHALVLDGVFASGGGRLRFHTLPALTTADVADVLATIVPRVLDWLARHGDREEDAADEWLETSPILAGLAAASVQGVAALGPAAGRRVQRFGSQPRPTPHPWPPVRRGRTDSICMQRCASTRSARAIGTRVSICAVAARGAGPGDGHVRRAGAAGAAPRVVGWHPLGVFRAPRRRETDARRATAYWDLKGSRARLLARLD